MAPSPPNALGVNDGSMVLFSDRRQSAAQVAGGIALGPACCNSVTENLPADAKHTVCGF